MTRRLHERPAHARRTSLFGPSPNGAERLRMPNGQPFDPRYVQPARHDEPSDAGSPKGGLEVRSRY